VIRTRQAEQTVPMPEDASGMAPAVRPDGTALRQALTRALAQLQSDQPKFSLCVFLKVSAIGKLRKRLAFHKCWWR